LRPERAALSETEKVPKPTNLLHRRCKVFDCFKRGVKHFAHLRLGMFTIGDACNDFILTFVLRVWQVNASPI
jgi:hypothetical protein